MGRPAPAGMVADAAAALTFYVTRECHLVCDDECLNEAMAPGRTCGPVEAWCASPARRAGPAHDAAREHAGHGHLGPSKAGAPQNPTVGTERHDPSTRLLDDLARRRLTTCRRTVPATEAPSYSIERITVNTCAFPVLCAVARSRTGAAAAQCAAGRDCAHRKTAAAPSGTRGCNAARRAAERQRS
jgi:hypothetical protein